MFRGMLKLSSSTACRNSVREKVHIIAREKGGLLVVLQKNNDESRGLLVGGGTYIMTRVGRGSVTSR